MNALVYHIISYASSSSSSHFLLSGQIYTHTHTRASALHFEMQMRNKSTICFFFFLPLLHKGRTLRRKDSSLQRSADFGQENKELSLKKGGGTLQYNDKEAKVHATPPEK